MAEKSNYEYLRESIGSKFHSCRYILYKLVLLYDLIMNIRIFMIVVQLIIY